MKRMLFVMVAAAAMSPLVAQAANEKVWLSLSSGGTEYGMTDINRELEAYNSSSSGADFPLVQRGLSFGLAAGYETPSRWNFGAGVERMFAETKASDASGSVRYQFTANCWRAFAEYALRGIGHSSLRLGAGIGMVAASGKYTQADPNNGPVDLKIGGSAPLYEAYAGWDVWMAPQLAITAASGYRRARLNSVDIAGGTLINSNGEATPVDYSGPYLRMGVKLVGKSSSE